MTENILDDRVAIVTGAGRGMGRAMAMALAEAGARIVATAARSRDELDALSREIAEAVGPDRVLALTSDVSDEDQCRGVVEQARARFGGVHVLVNNAARGHKFIHDANPGQPMDFWNADSEAWRLMIDTNVNGPFYMAKAVTPSMITQGWGRIINISATLNTMQKTRNAPYGISKAALESETLIWSKDVAGTGVTVNTLSPGGATLTGMVYGEARNNPKLLKPEIMKAPIVWLASDASDGINGERIIAKDWDASLDATAAGKAAIAPPAFLQPD